MTRNVARIENWSICDTSNDPFMAPERRAKRLQGNVYGHPSFEDGHPITTSRIVEHDYPSKTVMTVNTVYKLGTIDPLYVKYMEDNGIRPVTFKPEDFMLTCVHCGRPHGNLPCPHLEVSSL